MDTGEGKTLVVALATVLAGWRGRGCYAIMADGYLADRGIKHHLLNQDQVISDDNGITALRRSSRCFTG